MRKLIGSWVTWGLPVVALAMVSGCQRSPDVGSASAKAEAGIQGAALADEKANLGDDLAELCGFKCNTLADGTASISGDVKIDSFFQAVISLKGQTSALDADVNATLSEMATAIGAAKGATAAATAANIKAELTATAAGTFGGNFKGGIKLVYTPPKCSVSASATVEAQAQCEAKVTPGTAEVECKGECVAKADAMLDCGADVKVMCKGTAPELKCEGSCEGSCQLEAGAKCEGTCSGTCDVSATGNCDGTCSVALEGGKCNGTCELRAGAKCDGECKGSCELTAGAECNGECKGECTYEKGSGSCEAGAQASCEMKGGVEATCKGECKGEVTPPKVEAECDASVKAQAQFSAECSPPKMQLTYEFAAGVDATAQIGLRLQAEAFAKAYGKLTAKKAKVKGIIDATGGLAAAGEASVKGLATTLSGSGDAKVVFKAGCALQQIGPAVKTITDATTQLKSTLDATATVTDVFEG